MSDAERILSEIDRHDATIAHSDLQRAELMGALGDFITGVAMHEATAAIAGDDPEHTAVVTEVRAKAEAGRKRIGELIEEAIKAECSGLVAQHHQAKLRAELLLPPSDT